VLIENPTLTILYGKFRYVDAPFKLTFSSDTRMSVCDDLTAHEYGFVFTTFQDIISKKCSDRFSIGMILKVFFYCALLYNISSISLLTAYRMIRLTKTLSLQIFLGLAFDIIQKPM
jgi:hypothetical protein